MTDQHAELNTVRERAKRKLERDMGPRLLAHLNDSRTVEIMLNADGRLWLERLGEPMSCIGSMRTAQAQAIIETIAGFHGKEVTRSRPILEGELPLDGSRFAGQLPPVVPAPTFAIRKKAVAIFTLDQYVERGIMTAAQRDVLVAAVRAHRNVLVIGGTGSGKTTLVNAIINEMVMHRPCWGPSQKQVRVCRRVPPPCRRSLAVVAGVMTLVHFPRQPVLARPMRNPESHHRKLARVRNPTTHHLLLAARMMAAAEPREVAIAMGSSSPPTRRATLQRLNLAVMLMMLPAMTVMTLAHFPRLPVLARRTRNPEKGLHKAVRRRNPTNHHLMPAVRMTAANGLPPAVLMVESSPPPTRKAALQRLNPVVTQLMPPAATPVVLAHFPRPAVLAKLMWNLDRCHRKVARGGATIRHLVPLARVKVEDRAQRE